MLAGINTIKSHPLMVKSSYVIFDPTSTVNYIFSGGDSVIFTVLESVYAALFSRVNISLKDDLIPDDGNLPVMINSYTPLLAS